MIRITLRKLTCLPLWSVSQAVIHDLQQHIVCTGPDAFLDFVEQHHAMRMLIDTVGQQTALVEADIARRRADQARNRMPLHIFGHVETDQFDAQRRSKLFCDLGLADAGRTREQIGANRLLRLAQAGARELDRGRERIDRLVLTEHHALERLFEMFQHLGIVLRTLFGGIRAMVAMVVSISFMPMVFLRLFSATSICAAGDSSITSIALSGSLRSWM